MKLAMQQLTQTELANWLALYAAAGLCCTIAFFLACATTIIEIHRERAWATVHSLRSAMLFLPKSWWRWQKHYLTSMPATLVIVVLFGASLRWS
jgi:hypothetical protein